MELRPYQCRITKAVLRNLFGASKKIPVIGMATGSGKTVTAYAIIQNFLERKPDARVLVLAHNQVVLRRNFKNGGSSDSYELLNARDVNLSLGKKIVITLPATFAKVSKKAGRFDLLVIDEAHEHWSAPRVQKIYNDIGSPKPVLLTASHSHFPRSSHEKHLYSVLEGYEDGHLPKVNIVLLGVHTDEICEYDEKEDLRQSVKFCHDDVLEICEELSDRLFKIGNGLFPKTMIMCHSVLMARTVFECFKELQIRSADISISPSMYVERHLSDPNSDNLERFKKQKNCKLLVVAKRGVLGFDCPDLEVVCDLTGTRNIERTRQHIGRLFRLSEEKQKTFIKVVPHEMEYYGLYLMGAVVALMHRDNDFLFEGDLKSVPILVKRSKVVSVHRPAQLKWFREESLFTDCPILEPEEYNECFSAVSGEGRFLWDIGSTNLEEVKNFERGQLEAKKTILLQYANSGKGKPMLASENMEERVLARYLQRITNKESLAYDENLTTKLRSIREDWFDFKVERKERLVAFSQNLTNEKPSLSDPDRSKRIIRRIFNSYAEKSGKNFDANFRADLMCRRPDWFLASHTDRKDLLMAFAASGKMEKEDQDPITSTLKKWLGFYSDPYSRYHDSRFCSKLRRVFPAILKENIGEIKRDLLHLARHKSPKPNMLIPTMRHLAQYLHGLTTKGRKYDLEFHNKLKKIRPDWFSKKNRTIKHKETLFAIAKSPGSMRPRISSNNPDEGTLARALESYVTSYRKYYDRTFTRKLQKLRPDWFEIQKSPSILKEQILEAARAGAARPRPEAPHGKESEIGRALPCYVISWHSSYDYKFHKQLVELRPDWFVEHSFAKPQILDGVVSTREKLSYWPLDVKDQHWFLRNYLDSKSPWFYAPLGQELAKIRKKCNKQTTEEIKTKLLFLAKSSAARPSSKDFNPATVILGRNLKDFTEPNNPFYDRLFHLQIKSMRPDWFLRDITGRKQAILKLAKTGAPRPSVCSRKPEIAALGRALPRYTISTRPCYDKALTKQLKSLRPEWFNYTPLAEKQDLLLKIAKRGKKRPTIVDKDPKQRALARVLHKYTSGSRRRKYLEFNKKLQTLRPDWFTKKCFTDPKPSLCLKKKISKGDQS